ncbi:MAG: hypothetical protein HQL52_11500 [Magnetococcales bacterium]|nr:hypothetical protein [Magnetococcales bacterium]
MFKPYRLLLMVTTLLVVFAFTPTLDPWPVLETEKALAKSKGKSRSSSRSKKKASWGRSKASPLKSSYRSGKSQSKKSASSKKSNIYSNSKSTRNATSSGYAKPGKTAGTSSGYTKPGKTAASSNGYTKPGTAATSSGYAKSEKTATSSGRYTKPGQSKTTGAGSEATQKVTFKSQPKISALDRKLARKQSAKALGKRRSKHIAARSKLVSESRTSKTYRNVTRNRTFDRRSIGDSRRRFYNRYDPFPSRYRSWDMFGSDRHYGGFDSGFLMTMLLSQGMGKEMGDTMLWYSLTGSPAISLFLADSKREAMERGDSELLQRVEQLERDNRRLQNQGTARPSLEQALETAEIPPEAVFQEEVLTGELSAPPISFGTGAIGGAYAAFCLGDDELVGFKERAMDLAVECAHTAGSVDNLRGFQEGRFDALLAQSDVVDAWLRQSGNPVLGPFQMSIYQEPFWLLVHEKSDIDALDDLDPKRHKIYVGPEGSGSAEAWNHLAQRSKNGGLFGDQDLSPLTTRHSSYLGSAAMVAGDVNQAAFMVMGLHSELMRAINDKFGNRLKLVPVHSNELVKAEDREGNPIYRSCEIPGGVYSELQEGWINLTSGVETLCVDTVLALSPQWIENHGPWAENIFLESVTDAIAEVRDYQGLAD